MKSGDLDRGEYLRSRIRAPILWIIIPLVVGYSVARVLPRVSWVFLLCLGGLLGAIWVVAWWKRLHRELFWRAVGVVCIFVVSWGYLLARLPLELDWAGRPEREANLVLRVIQVGSLDKYDRWSGYGEVVGASRHLEELIGQKVSFALSWRDREGEMLVRSQVVKVRGILSSIARNTDNAYEGYLYSQGIGFKLSRGQILETEFEPSGLFKFCERQREYLEEILAWGRGRDDGVVSLYRAMLLGNQASLTPDQKYAFRMTGSFHLFSVSGLHVAMVAVCIAFLMKWVRMSSVLGGVIGLFVLFLYVEITGGAPSAMRAFLMVAFYWGARVFRRKKSAFSALLASGLVALIVNPFDLFNIGFQLSYGVVGSILLYGVPLNEVVNNWFNVRFGEGHVALKNSLRWLFNLLGISLAANIGSTFLTILYFKTFAPGAVLLSVVVIPLASLVIVMGCFSLLLGLIELSMLSGFINPISWWVIRVMEMCVKFSLKIPGLFWESVEMWSILVYMALGAVFVILYLGHVFNKLRRLVFYSLPIMIIVLFTTLGVYMN